MASDSHYRLAGGLILVKVFSLAPLVEFLENYNSDNSKDLKKSIKNKVIEIMLGDKEIGEGLKNSLDLSRKLLNQIKEGYMEACDIIVDLTFELLTKGLTGIGGGLFNAVLEVGLEIDPLLGLPVYRGSSIKGALRSIAEELLGEEKANLLFGSTGLEGHVGIVKVSDALPVGCNPGNPSSKGGCLVYTGDVITPHYFIPEKGIVEKEYEAKPTPIQSLAIAPGTVYRFILGACVPRGDEDLRRKLSEAINHASNKGLIPKGLDERTGLGILIASLLRTVFDKGFAARSSKGYNVLAPYDSSDLERTRILRLNFSTYSKSRQGNHSSQNPYYRDSRRERRGSYGSYRRRSSSRYRNRSY